MQTNSWQSMTPDRQADALAERLGWYQQTTFTPWLHWFDGGNYICDVDDFTITDGRSMLLVVEAIEAKGWERFVHHYQAGHVSVVFAKYNGYGEAERGDGNEPAATAEAAWRALGREANRGTVVGVEQWASDMRKLHNDSAIKAAVDRLILEAQGHREEEE